MNTKRTFLKTVVFLSLMLLLAGAVQMPRAAWASMEDAAIFYEELNQHGEWVEYDNYGPVWYPTRVEENWRPYVDGRWTPADEGYVFETSEPWGWATYHYGNWMPTEEYGWVWVPGRTWYPNTVTWRTSPETESPDESYIGWAPIPPPNYTPQPGYYPEGYYGGGPYQGPFDNLITAPFWIFVRAASFLLGFSEPYAPSYSYWGCGCLAPPPVAPYYYNRTVVVHNYYTPDYYPRGIWAGRGYYNWGPPIPYVSRVTRIKQVNINNYVRQVNIYQRRNVAPPPGLVARRSYFRQVLPPAMVKHHPLPRGKRVRDVHMARANLVRPHLIKAEAIKGAPVFRAQIPKTRANRGRDGQWRRGVPGAALPASAMMRHNQQMENHVRKIPSSQQIQPVSPQARKWQVPGRSGAPGAPVTPGGQSAGFHQRRGPEAASPAAATPRAAPPGTEGARMRPGGPQAIPPTMRPPATPGAPGVAGAAGGRGHQTATIEGRPSRAPSPSPAAVAPERSQPGKGQPPGTWSRQKPATPPPAAATRGKPQAQGQQRHYTPSSPQPRAAGPVRVQPPARPPSPQPSAAPPQPQPQPKAQPQAQPQRQPRKFQPPKQSAPERPQGFGGGQPGMSRSRPDYRPYQPQPPRQVRQQPAPQPSPRVQQQPFPQAKPQVRQQPRPQPQRQVRQQPRFQPRSQPQPQVRQQPRPQPQRQVRQQPQRQVQPQVRQQPRPQPQRQVRQQPKPQARPQAKNRPQPQPQQGRDKQLSQQN